MGGKKYSLDSRFCPSVPMFHVEQSMNLIKICLYVVILVGLGCRKPMSDPQAGDYIYQDLKNQLALSEGKLTERKEQLEEQIIALKEADIDSSQRKQLKFKIDKAASDIRKLEQRVLYWKLKILSREEHVRKEYLKAFNKGETWDNSVEIERYKKAQKSFLGRTIASQDEEDKSKASPPPSQGH